MYVVCLDGVPSIEIDSGDPGSIVLVLGHVADFVSQIHVSEADLCRDFGERRREEFSSGRRLANVALRHFDKADEPVLRRDRLPVWPHGYIGSISHAESMAACVVATSSSLVGIGLDLTGVAAVSERVASRILTEAELKWIEEQGEHQWFGALFSAKESIYKAVNPIVGEFLGFRDVELVIDEEALSFTAHTDSDRPSTDFVKRGYGEFHRVHGHWLTLFFIPP